MGELVDLALAARDMVAHGWFGAVKGDACFYTVVGSAPQHCATTAIGEVTHFDRGAWLLLRDLCLEVLGISPPSPIALVDWNNHPDRTQEEVINMFDDVARLIKDRELG